MTNATWADVVIALAPTITIIVAWYFQAKRLDVVHGLVNSRLQAALDELKLLKAHLESIQRHDG